MHERTTPEDKKRWQEGFAAGCEWADAAPVERLAKIVNDLDHDQEQRRLPAEDCNPLNPTMRVLASMLDEVTPAKITADKGHYFPMGVRSGILLTWHNRRTPIELRN